MSKILDVNNLLEAGKCLPDRDLALFTARFEGLTKDFAEAIAKRLEIKCTDVSYQGSAFGGLCATFGPAHEGQPCPDAIEGLDSGGEWE